MLGADALVPCMAVPHVMAVVIRGWNMVKQCLLMHQKYTGAVSKEVLTLWV